MLPIGVAFLDLVRALLTIGVREDTHDGGLWPVFLTKGQVSVGQGLGDETIPGGRLRLQLHVMVNSHCAVSLSVCGTLTEHSLVKPAEVLDVNLLGAVLRILRATILVLINDYKTKEGIKSVGLQRVVEIRVKEETVPTLSRRSDKSVGQE